VKNTGLVVPNKPTEKILLDAERFCFDKRQVQHKRLDPYFVVKTMHKLGPFGWHVGFVSDNLVVLKHRDADHVGQHAHIRNFLLLLGHPALDALGNGAVAGVVALTIFDVIFGYFQFHKDI